MSETNESGKEPGVVLDGKRYLRDEDIGSIPKEKLPEAFVNGVVTCAKLLKAIPSASLAEVFMRQDAVGAVERMVKHRKDWMVVFAGIAEDLERQLEHMSKARGEARECLALANQCKAVFTGREFVVGMERLEGFVGLLREVKALGEDGTVRKVLEGLR